MRKSVIVILVLSCFLMLSCVRREKSDDNVLRWSMAVKPKGLDPVSTHGLYSHQILSLINEGLLKFHYLARPYSLEPNLAESMPEVSDDGITYTFKLKKGTYFYPDKCFGNDSTPSRELTAEDVIYSIKRVADFSNRSTGWWVFDGKIKGLNAFRENSKAKSKTLYDESVEGLELVDKYTMKFHLVKPVSYFNYLLTMSYAMVVAPEAVDYYGEEYLNHPVGSGPYHLTKWVKGSKLVLEKNLHYRDEFYPSEGAPGDREAGLLADAGKKIPFIDKIELHIITESQPRWLKFESGQLDGVEIPKDNFDNTVKDGELLPKYIDKGMILAKWQQPDLTYTAFNMKDPIVGKNKFLRQAMNLAFDAREDLKIFQNGRGILSHSPIPPDMDGYDADFKNNFQDYNLDKARELLKKAGYPGGKGLPTLSYLTRTSTTARQRGEQFKLEMAKIGINIKVDNVTWPEKLKREKTGNFQMVGSAWIADYPDPENFMQLLYGPNGSPGPNQSYFSNPVYDSLHEIMASIPSSPERNKLMDQMKNIIADECPWIFGLHRLGYLPYYHWLKNFKVFPITEFYPQYYRIDVAAREKALKN